MRIVVVVYYHVRRRRTRKMMNIWRRTVVVQIEFVAAFLKKECSR
jgi:hypothetical protein